MSIKTYAAVGAIFSVTIVVAQIHNATKETDQPSQLTAARVEGGKHCIDPHTGAQIVCGHPRLRQSSDVEIADLSNQLLGHRENAARSQMMLRQLEAR